MAKTDWTSNDIVMPADMNAIGEEINEALSVAQAAETPTGAEAKATAAASAMGIILTDRLDDQEQEIAGLKSSGVDGKNQLEAAVIAKEGAVSKQGLVATFDELDDGIRSIPVGSDTSDATAVAGDMRAGMTAYGQAGTKMTGTIPVQTGGNVVPAASDIVKPAGIYDTPITVKGVAVPPANVLTGTTIAGTAGTMPNRGALNQTITTQNGVVNLSAGYFSAGQIKATFANLVAGNVKSGVNIGGVVGNLEAAEPITPGENIHLTTILTPMDSSDNVWRYVGSPIYVYKKGTYRVSFTYQGNASWAGHAKIAWMDADNNGGDIGQIYSISNTQVITQDLLLDPTGKQAYRIYIALKALYEGYYQRVSNFTVKASLMPLVSTIRVP